MLSATPLHQHQSAVPTRRVASAALRMRSCHPARGMRTPWNLELWRLRWPPSWSRHSTSDTCSCLQVYGHRVLMLEERRSKQREKKIGWRWSRKRVVEELVVEGGGVGRKLGWEGWEGWGPAGENCSSESLWFFFKRILSRRGSCLQDLSTSALISLKDHLGPVGWWPRYPSRKSCRRVMAGQI